MRPHGLHPHDLDDEKRKRFLEFIRQVSPTADSTSVLLFIQVMHANNLLEHAAERTLGGAGLSWAKFRLLTNLHRGEHHGATEGMQPSELSDAQEVSRNTVSALISSLEKDGLISRELHGTDHRRFVIRLTPEGRKLLRTKMGSQFKFVTQCFDGFSAAERQTFLDFLNRLNHSLVDKNK
ncbi:MAG: MarR family transcriptional regulator [Chloroflexota bacterium]|nr:MarR family transcriptional regulator [Chloroflexota bacterium]